MRKLVAGLVALSTLAACAQDPNAIVAKPVTATDKYDKMSCRQLDVQLYTTETQLAELSAAQRAERNRDTAWVAGGALLFLPAMLVATGGVDYEDEIATRKGEVQAMKTTQLRRGC